MLLRSLYMGNDKLPPEHQLSQEMLSHVDLLHSTCTLGFVVSFLAPLLSSKTVMHIAPKLG